MDRLLDLITFFDAKDYTNNKLIKTKEFYEWLISLPFKEKIIISDEIINKFTDNKYKAICTDPHGDIVDLYIFAHLILDIFSTLDKIESKKILQKMMQNNTYLISLMANIVITDDNYDKLVLLLPYMDKDAKNTALCHSVVVSESPNLIRLLIYYGADKNYLIKVLLDDLNYFVDKDNHKVNIVSYFCSYMQCGIANYIGLKYYYDGNTYIPISLFFKDELSQVLSKIID